MATVCYLISLFLFRNAAGLAVVTLGLAAMVWLSKVPFGYMVKGLKAILVILIISTLFQLFLTPGETLAAFWKLKITRQGVRNAGFMIVRLTYLIMGSSLLTLTTTPNQLTDGLEKALKPLGKVHVPVHEVTMMMSIALRFIPILIEETDKIMKAQQARGADFESGNVHAPPVGSAVYLCIPQSQRPGDGHGSQMLPGRRGKDKDEAPGLPPPGCHSLSGRCGVFCSHNCGKAAFLVYAIRIL